MNKKLIIVGTVAAIGLAGIGTATYAATQANSQSDLAQTLATKFNINKDEVQKVLDEQREAKKAEREQKIKDEIAQLVKDGKLSQEQADKLNTKRAELQKEREANKSTTKLSEMTDEQREAKKAEREKKQTELKAWLKEQGIDESYIKYLSGKGGPRGESGDKAKSQATSSSTQTSNS